MIGLFGRLATVAGLAAGGAAAARAVASLTPEERRALAELLDAAKELAGQGFARATRGGGSALTLALSQGERERYRAGPLNPPGVEPIPVGLRGPHGELP